MSTRGFPVKFESSNLSRDNLSREIGRGAFEQQLADRCSRALTQEETREADNRRRAFAKQITTIGRKSVFRDRTKVCVLRSR